MVSIQCRSGFSFLSHCGSGSREPNQRGSMRTRVRIPILVRLSSQGEKLNFPRKIRIPIRVRIRIQDNQINADPCGTGSGFRSWSGLKVRKNLIFTRKIRIPNNDPDPGQPNQCGSMWIRIRNTAFITHVAPNSNAFQCWPFSS
jgi:hypothetical protein